MTEGIVFLPNANRYFGGKGDFANETARAMISAL